jgi:tetraacyldisaccharide 4'-kinase
MLTYWRNRNLISISLYPFSMLFRGIVFLRKFCYRAGIIKTHYFPIPIIVIGNITVGGCGKTPCVNALYYLLVANGWRPAVVARGYGGKAKSYPVYVDANSNPSEVGDEPLLLAKSGCTPLLVSADRCLAINEIVTNTDCNIIISDDGLQHYAMYRDIEIALFDKAVGVGNGFMLPAGMLREPLARLAAVDFILFKGGLPAAPMAYNEKLFAMDIIFDGFYSVVDGSLIDIIKIKKANKVVSLAGIANPDSFKGLLENLGIRCELKIFSDHYKFSARDIDLAADYILMTEKDAVKCKDFADSRHLFLRIKADFSASFVDSLLRHINKIR